MINLINKDYWSQYRLHSLKQRNNIRAALPKKNVTGITDEIKSELAYLLGQIDS